MRHFHPLKVPVNVHPLVRRLFEEMNREQIGILDMSKRSGVNKNTLNDWKARSNPQIQNLDACFAVLGMELNVRAKRDD
ncbi:MAG: hypothetical protein RLZZ555_2339 [Pseudomonadota bacterium]